MRLAVSILIAICCVSCAAKERVVATPKPSPTPASSAADASSCAKGPVPTPSPAAEADTSTKPTVEVPSGQPPCSLVVADIKEGAGAVVKEGDTVTVQYVGVAWSTKKQFDSSWDRGGEPATFPLSGVIPGWTHGIPGMKEGGRRELIIPPDQAYGPRGYPPDIGPNETLVFVIDLVKVGEP